MQDGQTSTVTAVHEISLTVNVKEGKRFSHLSTDFTVTVDDHGPAVFLAIQQKIFARV